MGGLLSRAGARPAKMSLMAQTLSRPRRKAVRHSAERASADLSPSLAHQHLMDQIHPALAYDGGDVAAWQKRLRRRLAQRLGYDHMPRPGSSGRVPLNVRTLWRREHRLGTIEKLLFTAEAGADVPAYLCLPRNVRPPYPTFICLQGHSSGMHNSIAVDAADERTPIPVSGDRDFALGCLRRGIAALCIEQRAFGEREERHQAQRCPHSRCHDAAWRAVMLGRTLIAERVYDVDRGIDLLAQRDDIDMGRLGILGNSGGGTITTYAAALLPRLRLAMPSCAFCTFRESILSIYHCGDNYVPGLMLDADMADVLGLFAPRPVVVVAGARDNIFPIAGVRLAFEGLRRIYRAAGAPGNCKLVIGAQGHRFYARAAWQAMQPYLAMQA